MKKNWALRLASMALVLSLVTMSLVSGTFAKYAKAVTGNDMARAAKFAFNLTDADDNVIATQASDTATFPIFNYTDAGVFNNGVNGAEKFIAPGTTGTFALTVENLSEVDVTLVLNLAETNDGDIPVYYTISAAPDAQRYSSVLTGSYTDGTYQDLTALAAALSSATLEASNGATATTADYTLNWVWAFDSAGTGQTDISDTAIGTAGTLPTVQLSVTATVTQVN
jgi:hypothetical protein